ncbi:MAG TPA: iron ABC transporter permease [Candidatus Limnocylindrales bacterium]|jgi:iron(III) transport system permease protein|nr:iron ABC transporter permease [Candidatus Limnocylindrales bacterium]
MAGVATPRWLGRSITPVVVRPAAHPALVLVGLAVAAFALLPLVYLVVRAVGAEAEGLAFVVRPRTVEVVLGTLALAGVVGLGAVALGVPLAWLTSRSDLPGRRLWTVLVVVPLAVPSYLSAFAFIAAFGPRGALQSLLEPLGVDRLPDVYGFPGAAAVLVLATYPYVLLTSRAALLRADPAVEEAARSLGDGPLETFVRVSLPVLVPAIGAGALLAVLYALSDFGAVSLLQFDSLSRAIYVQYRASFDRSLAAVLALLLVALALAVTWAEARIRRGATVGGHTPRRPAATVRLGRWRWPALAFVGIVVVLGLLVPVGTILFWLIRGLAQGEPLVRVGAATVNSLLGGSAAAAATSLLVLPVAVLLVRHPGRLAGLVESAVTVGWALPGIVVALAAVFFAATVTPFLYQTFALLVLGYTIRFLPQALGPVRSALARMGPRMEEAGRGLGQGPLGVFATVTLPLLRPSLVAGAALVFLTAVKELPMTLLLGPIGFETLATRIWSAASEGFFARAAAPALVLLALSGASVALLLRAEEVRA